MCGIAGKLNFNSETVSEDNIQHMLSKIAHRGPDDSGVFIDETIGLGHQRLSIIDLSEKGHQPMSDASKRYWIVFNGEIYNYKELRIKLEKEGIVFASDTDTEVIVNLYAQQGKECLSRLSGMFAFAIWDTEKKELFIARDRVGKKPLKYYIDDTTFLFASELKAILADKKIKKEIDWIAIDAYLTYKYVPAPHTGFKKIYKLPPASYAIIKNGAIKIHTYWDIDFKKKQDLREGEWIEKIEEALKESVKKRLYADVPLGVHLSGGVDSSLITAIAAQESKDPITTFSIGFKEKEYNELSYAALVAKQYGTNHHERIVMANMTERIPHIVSQYEEPYADASTLPTWVLAEMTKEKITVVLSGDGGDENFAGYERNLIPKLHFILSYIPGKKVLRTFITFSRLKNKRLKNLKRILDAYNKDIFTFYENIITQFSVENKDKVYTTALKEKLKNKQSHEARIIFESTSDLEMLDRFLYTGIKTFLPDDLLVKVDMATMYHGIEARSPFLDHEFLELTAQIPGHLKIKGFNKKYILKKIAEKYIPHECIYRPKKGFTVPIKEWLQNELNPILRENLLSATFINYGFKREALFSMIEKHEKGEVDYSNELWTLLMLRLWLKEWFET